MSISSYYVQLFQKAVDETKIELACPDHNYAQALRQRLYRAKKALGPEITDYDNLRFSIDENKLIIENEPCADAELIAKVLGENFG